MLVYNEAFSNDIAICEQSNSSTMRRSEVKTAIGELKQEVSPCFVLYLVVIFCLVPCFQKDDANYSWESCAMDRTAQNRRGLSSRIVISTTESSKVGIISILTT
jgi:hypothetical protein